MQNVERERGKRTRAMKVPPLRQRGEERGDGGGQGGGGRKTSPLLLLFSQLCAMLATTTAKGHPKGKVR